MIKVLFVCLGNICRSPTAEGIFKSIVSDLGLDSQFYIDSAGTSAYHVGETPDVRMRRAAQKRGYELNSNSRQFTTEDFTNFDHIVVMDKSNLRDVLSLDKSNLYKNRVSLMTDYSTNYRNSDVPDPYYGADDGFNIVIDILEESLKGFINSIV
ncbi:low molecular weight phosphotyrosine protein phosphatase [Thiospirochaeta perfilievii]|uniref:Low molecular weight phosphotyrosine protein phosphatase n=1 Tax=Thiospirochaeta perfilievii TaxID=252967 RepID=A0A5C1Q501_9SPIO|nr:low molecular weight protein-tyrosine-phosphatase [Thiospirochaeta perfilievii]QEN03153.1 low molecular weight phosphotyrosine protein phosphatase [Thiospirochaeta perfilievii]